MEKLTNHLHWPVVTCLKGRYYSKRRYFEDVESLNVSAALVLVITAKEPVLLGATATKVADFGSGVRFVFIRM